MAFMDIKIKVECAKCGDDMGLCENEIPPGINQSFKIGVLPCKKCNQEYEQLKSLLKKLTKN